MLSKKSGTCPDFFENFIRAVARGAFSTSYDADRRQTVEKVLRAAARFKQDFAAYGEIHKNPRHVRGFLYKPTASVPVRARAAAGILNRKRGFD